jgi:predicted phage terminase large subunit-like protein
MSLPISRTFLRDALAADPTGFHRKVRAERCRRKLSQFFRQGWHVLEPSTPLTWNWHHDAVLDHVQALLEDWMRHRVDPSYVQRYQNLLVNVPPGTAKSRMISVYMPAWMWIRCPEWRVIFLSANPRVALRDAVYCRDVIRSDWYRDTFNPDWRLTEDTNAKGLYRNTQGGFRMAMGFTAQIVGDRGDCICVDDPHDPEEVFSDAVRREIKDRWTMAIGNRVNDLRSSVRIGIGQRVHDDDWHGLVLKEGTWEHLNLPQEYDPARARTTAIGWHDPRTEPGEILDPVRFTPRVLKDERQKGVFYFSGQHNQDPVPGEGGKFKKAWLRYWTPEGGGEFYRLHLAHTTHLVKARDCRRIGTVDLAFSEKQEADNTVISAWAITPDCDLLLLDCERGHIPDNDVIPAIGRMSRRHKLSYVGIEDTQAQILVVKQARREGLTIKAISPESKSKTERAVAATTRMEAEQIFLPEQASYLNDIVEELLRFPKGHDDFVDCLSYAVREVIRFGGPGETEDEKKAREEAEVEAKRKAQEAYLNPGNPVLWR